MAELISSQLPIICPELHRTVNAGPQVRVIHAKFRPISGWTGQANRRAIERLSRTIGGGGYSLMKDRLTGPKRSSF